MALTITTPLMNLTLPIPGPLGQVGPQWASDLNAAFSVIDGHTHTSGSGNPITTAAISINADLPFNSFNATGLRSTRYNVLGGTLSNPDVACVYSVSGDLFWNNGSGTPVQITSGTTLNVGSLGAIGGDYAASGALLSYNNTTKTYAFRQGTPTTTAPAGIVCGTVAVTEQVAGGQAITLQTPTGFSGPYNITLPAGAPATNQLLQLSPAGVMTAGVIQLQQITDNWIPTVKIQDLAVTLGKLATAVQQALCPTGSVLAYAASTAPAGYLLCDGAAVSRTTFAALFAVIGITHGQGDGSTTFNLPDYRGRFLRGRDGGAARDPDRASRTAMNTGGATGDNVGSVQGSEFSAHQHGYTTSNLYTSPGTPTGILVRDGSGNNAVINASSAGGNETRPINAYVNYIIKT